MSDSSIDTKIDDGLSWAYIRGWRDAREGKENAAAKQLPSTCKVYQVYTEGYVDSLRMALKEMRGFQRIMARIRFDESVEQMKTADSIGVVK